MMNMKLRAVLVLAAVLTMFIPGQVVSAQDNQAAIHITQVDTSKFPQVTVYVSVTDASGEPLAVDPNQIQIFENGQLVQPQQVSGQGEIGPLTTMLVMDVSGSMFDAGKLEAAKAAAQAYVEQMRPSDQAGLLTFNTDVSYPQPITSDRQALIDAIDRLNASGDTAMYDALDRAEEILQAVPGRKAIIVLTDGLDNRSAHTPDQVIQAIGAGGLSISIIGLGDPNKLGINSGLDQAALQSLAKRAGGVYGYANDPQALVGLYERYGRALQSEYSFTYTSLLPLRDGLNRALTVQLGTGAEAQSQYNPGGVLPEVAHSASWPVFAILLAVLVALLFVPGLIGRLLARKSKPHIRLK
jgi:VWFA-related protein